MNRIKEVIITIPTYGRTPIVTFRDEWDVGYNLWGKSFYRPSWASLERLRRATHDMAPDIDFANGLITLRARAAQDVAGMTERTARNWRARAAQELQK